MIYLLYLPLFVGLVLSFGASCRSLQQAIAFELKMRTSRFRGRKRTNVHQIDIHIRKLLQATLGQSNEERMNENAVIFYAISIILCLLTLLFLAVRTTFTFAVVISLIAGCAPYLFLYSRLQRIRIDSSYEGDILINEFCNQYKMNYRNIPEALEKTALNLSLSEAPFASLNVARLCRRLREARSDREIDAAIDGFVFQIDTEWARKLAYNISAAIKDNVQIDKGLADLVDEIGKARKIIEQGKRFNNEASFIIRFFTLPLYVISMVAIPRYLGYPVMDVFRLQFGTPTGIKYFTVILMVYVISILLLFAFDRQKMDL